LIDQHRLLPIETAHVPQCPIYATIFLAKMFPSSDCSVTKRLTASNLLYLK